MSTLPAGYIPQRKVTSAGSSESLGFIVCVKCCRMVDSVPRWWISLSWPIQSDHLSIADRMIPPSGQVHSHGKTQYIPGKQVLVRSCLWKIYCREQFIQFQFFLRLILEHFLRNLKFPIAMNGLKLNQDQEPLLWWAGRPCKGFRMALFLLLNIKVGKFQKVLSSSKKTKSWMTGTSFYVSDVQAWPAALLC